jgi:hypothetical protein
MADPVVLADFVDGMDFNKTEKVIKEAEKTIKEQGKTSKAVKDDLSDDVLLRIKQKLNPNYRQPRKKEYYVPPEVDDAMGVLSEQMAELEMQVVKTDPISFGRKVRVKAEKHWAEINVFYGKRGFTVVMTTKSGSSPELAKLAAEAMRGILERLEEKTRHGHGKT